MIVVGVRFKPAGKIYYFDPDNIELALDDGVIVETARGMEFGNVVIPPRDVDDSEVVQPLKPIIRKATAKDLRQVERNKEREKKAFGICLTKIAKHKLPMKLIDVDYTFDMGKSSSSLRLTAVSTSANWSAIWLRSFVLVLNFAKLAFAMKPR